MAGDIEILGRMQLATLHAEAAGLGLAQFVERFPDPFLFQMNESAAKKPLWQTTTKSDKHRTRAKGDWAPPAWAFKVQKRDQANVFKHMVTIGRAGNNDIVLPYPSVSKFHASLVRGKTGFLIADAGSMNGTFLDGVRLPAEKAFPIASGASIELGGEIVLVFVEPADAFEYVQTMRNAAKR